MKKSSDMRQTKLIEKYKKQAYHYFQCRTVNHKKPSYKKPPVIDIFAVLAIAMIISCGIAFIITAKQAIII